MSTYQRFEVGTTVRLETVDLYGYNGRTYHPVRNEDEGYVGIVVKVELEGCIDEDVADPLWAYRVCRPEDGKVLDLMSHEVVLVHRHICGEDEPEPPTVRSRRG